MNLFPLITKPSRITRSTATLIDNIFTNNIEGNIERGLLVKDISDQLPVFALYQWKHEAKETKKNIQIQAPNNGNHH